MATRRGTGSYLVAVANTELSQRPFELTSSLGPIKSVEEIQLDDAEVASCSTPGYVPTHTPAELNCGTNTNTTIAGLSQRIFAVTVEKAICPSSSQGLCHRFPKPEAFHCKRWTASSTRSCYARLSSSIGTPVVDWRRLRWPQMLHGRGGSACASSTSPAGPTCFPTSASAKRDAGSRRCLARWPQHMALWGLLLQMRFCPSTAPRRMTTPARNVWQTSMQLVHGWRGQHLRTTSRCTFAWGGSS